MDIGGNPNRDSIAPPTPAVQRTVNLAQSVIDGVQARRPEPGTEAEGSRPVRSTDQVRITNEARRAADPTSAPPSQVRVAVEGDTAPEPEVEPAPADQAPPPESTSPQTSNVLDLLA